MPVCEFQKLSPLSLVSVASKCSAVLSYCSQASDLTLLFQSSCIMRRYFFLGQLFNDIRKLFIRSFQQHSPHDLMHCVLWIVMTVILLGEFLVFWVGAQPIRMACWINYKTVVRIGAIRTGIRPPYGWFKLLLVRLAFRTCKRLVTPLNLN